MEKTPPRVKIKSPSELHGKTVQLNLNGKQVRGQVNIAKTDDGLYFAEFCFSDERDPSIQDWIWLSQADIDVLNLKEHVHR